jgi:hypothetical protein
MENTYTYTARSADHPERVVTFTLHDRRMSVGVGVPLEQAARFAEAVRIQDDEEEEEGEVASEQEADVTPKLWLKPVAVSLVERGTAPFRIVDIDVQTDDGWLFVRGWMRVAGLRLAPITLISGRVDNPDAAQAFAKEVVRRKEALATGPALLQVLDYWATWVLFTSAMVTLFTLWRHRSYDEEAGA